MGALTSCLVGSVVGLLISGSSPKEICLAVSVIVCYHLVLVYIWNVDIP